MGRLFEARTYRIIGMRLGVFFIASILRLIYATCRVKINGKVDPSVQHIVLFWHGELIMMPFIYDMFYSKKQRVHVMISSHRDGDFVAKIIESFGLDSIRGSTSSGAFALYKDAIRVLKNGDNICITPDGPRGPRHSVSNGSVKIAQSQNLPSIAINCHASSCWRFKSWDKSFIPKPFAKIEYFISEPFYLKDLDFDDAKNLVQQRLMQNAF